MKTIIVGLGNPGKKFENTRHNVGFMAIDKFAEKNDFPDFKLQKKSNALVSENSDIMLVKPQTFMNESGKAVKKISENSPSVNLIVVHDDIDLPVGKIKIIKDRGSAGHKGVESIINNIGNEGLIRFRIGISSEQYRGLVHGTKKAKKIVLKKFPPDEQKIINETISKTADALNFLIRERLEKAMNEYNS